MGQAIKSLPESHEHRYKASREAERVLVLLEHWGHWTRRQHEGGGHAPETILGKAYSGQLRADSKWQCEGLGEQSAMLDMDRRVRRLPESLQRVLFVEYVVGGTVSAKTSAARMPTATYYRRLGMAKQALITRLANKDPASNERPG